MYYFKNITQLEIAKHFNMSERTVRRKLSNIIEVLRKKYKK